MKHMKVPHRCAVVEGYVNETVKYFKGYATDKLIIAKIKMESQELLETELQFLHSALSLMAVSQCIKFHLILFLYFQRNALDKFNIAKIRKRNNSINSDVKVMVLAFCTFPHSPLSLYQVSFFFTFNTFIDMLQTCLLLQKLGREITVVITCDRVTVLALCTSSDGHLSTYQVSFNSLLYFQRYAPDKVLIAKIKKGSNSINTGVRIMLLVFCNSPHGPLSVYQFSFFFFQYF